MHGLGHMQPSDRRSAALAFSSATIETGRRGRDVCTTEEGSSPWAVGYEENKREAAAGGGRADAAAWTHMRLTGGGSKVTRRRVGRCREDEEGPLGLILRAGEIPTMARFTGYGRSLMATATWTSWQGSWASARTRTRSASGTAAAGTELNNGDHREPGLDEGNTTDGGEICGCSRRSTGTARARLPLP